MTGQPCFHNGIFDKKRLKPCRGLMMVYDGLLTETGFERILNLSGIKRAVKAAVGRPG
jgi:hypothetical protein